MEQKNELWELAKNTFRLRRRLEEETGKEFGLPAIEVSILAYLHLYEEDATASGIGREHGFKKNTISVHVENLVQKGFIERKERSGDRRRVELVLTETGETIAKTCLAEHEKLRKKLLAGLDQDDFAALQRCFDIINRNARSLLQN